MFGVARVDPQRVVVAVHATRRVVREGPATIARAVQARSAEVDPARVVGIDTDLAVVHRAVVGGAQMLPCVATIGRAVNAILLIALGLLRRLPAEPAAAEIGLYDRKDLISVPAIDVESDTALDAVWQPLGQFFPGISTVGRAMDAAARTATVEPESGASPLVHCSEQGLGIIRIHY